MMNTSNLKNIDASEVEVIYADSKEALMRAYDHGLNTAAEVRSTSPALIYDIEMEINQADIDLTPTRMKALEHGFALMGRDCRGLFGHEDVDLIASRYVTLEFQAIGGKAATLTNEDFIRPTSIVTLSSNDDPYLHSIVCSPLIRILAGNPNLVAFQTPIESLSRQDDPRQPDPSLYSRLRFTSLKTMLYRLCERISARFNLRGPRGTILMIRDNELSKETAFNLLLHGYFPRQLKISPVVDAPDLPEDQIECMRAACVTLVKTHLANLVCEDGVTVLSRILFEDIYDRTKRYYASLAIWDKTLDGLYHFRPRAVLTNRINDAELIGLHARLKSRGIPLVGFQHGVTVEINRHMRDLDAHYESSFCDIELTFNERAANYSNRNIFKRGKAISVGLPAEYFRGAKKGKLRDAPPVWFINTAFYIANHGQLEGTTDLDKCRHEVGLIENVLTKLKHKVLYKPYPGRRFEDPDPIEIATLGADNIELYQGRLDLRYIVGSAKVLISSRSFSTSSWCLVTGLPLVHIDIPEQEPLSPSARAAYEAGVFFFDSSDDGFAEKLCTFLNQPIVEIERLWKEKSAARDHLIHEFISATQTGAGRRGAAIVEAEILKRHGERS
jgi:hypothetical protein